MEKRKVIDVVSGIALLAIPFLAFSSDVAREIFRRDRGTCQCCGRKFTDGWMLHASHFDHDRSSKYYNSADNGQMECIPCHLQTHLSQMDNWGDYHYNSIVQLANLAMKEGFHTWKFYEQFGNEYKDRDREMLAQIFERNGYNLWDFVDVAGQTKNS